MSDRTVSVTLKAQVSGYVSGMRTAAQATTSMVDNARRGVGNVAQQLAGMSRGAQLVGAVGAIAIGRQFVNAARDMNETVNKTSVVFGNASDAVVAWSKDSAKAMGISTQQAQEAAGTFGNLFSTMGIGQAASAQMSQQLVGLASDLASFNNADPTDTLNALRSGLVGEVEPLRKFGVNLSEVTLKQKALEMGLISTTNGTLPPAIRTQAAYALILEQTTTAQGDFARTADGLANSQRTLNAEWQNTQAQLGQELLPLVNAGTQALTGLLGVVNGMPGPVRDVGVGVGALAAAFLLLAPRAADAYDAFKQIEVASPGAAKGLSTVAKSAGLVTVALAALSAEKAGADWLRELGGATTKSGDQAATALYGISDAGQLTHDTFKALGATTADLNDMLTQTFDRSVWENVKQSTNILEHIGVSQDAVDEWDRFAKSADAGLSTLITQGGPAADAAKQLFGNLTDKMAAAGATTEQIAQAFPQVTAALNASKTAFTGVGDAASSAKTDIKSLKDMIDGLRGTQMSADEATANLEDAIDRATAAAKENGKAIGESTPKARANSQALRDLATAALDGVDAWNQNGASATAIKGKMQEARDAFVATATKMGMTKTEAEKLATAYGLIPKKVATEVTAYNGPALAAADAVKRRWMATVAYIGAHPAKYAGLAGAATGGYIGGYAGGGPVWGAGSATSDSIPAYLSNGEFVVNAAATSKHRALLESINGQGPGPVSRLSQPAGGGGGGGAFTVTAPVQLLLDSVAIWQGQLRLKRSRGGIELGLA